MDDAMGQKGRTDALRLRLRRSEKERLIAAARVTGEWLSEFVREAIKLRTHKVLGAGKRGPHGSL